MTNACGLADSCLNVVEPGRGATGPGRLASDRRRPDWDGGPLITPMLALFFDVLPLAALSSDLVGSAVMKPVGSVTYAAALST
jgi:hypothetical protein